ncbi:sugar lyase [Desulfosporosinus sp. HMP52]|uniref:flippase n=1 Tax=Desulfosporosinus sp. HMP52 TaxID=1487923 RepID=UPI00051FD600|nr:flippase [Desulfosporosinus sp. HMP52]KGK91415.1 sugar lyase [Desulfosporosinus sp. HMP52]
MGNSIAKNLMYNLLLQAATLVLPLMTVPYLSRILGAEGIGIYVYTLTFSQYFIIIGSLGLSLYGNRQIAYTRDNKDRMSRAFWSIFLLRIMTIGLALILYLIIFSKVQIYRPLFMIQILNIVAAMVDLSWLYLGLEDFKKTVTRSLIVKVIGVCLIFTFVRTSKDLNLYVLINVLIELLGNMVMWVYLPNTVNRVRLKFSDLLLHLVPSIKLFIPQIAIQVYVVLDKTMLGVLIGVEEVGYFEQSERIVKVVLGLVTALGVVMLPRMSNIFAKGDKQKMDSYLNISLKGVAYVAVPLTFGLGSISNEFVPWFFGVGFEPVEYLIIALAPILFFIAMSNVMGTQYLLPSNRTREFTASVMTGAIVNVILNLILIPHFRALGACLATVMAEVSVTMVQYYCLRREIAIKEYLKMLAKFCLAAASMALIVRIIGHALGVGAGTTFLQGVAGVVVYIAVLFLLREKINAYILEAAFLRLGKGKKSIKIS